MRFLSSVFAILFFFQSSYAAVAPQVKQLQKKIFDRKEKMQNRWNSLMELGAKYPGEGYRAAERVAKSSDWYMRHASMSTLVKTHPQKAAELAGRLLSDSSLLVRVAAVKTLKQTKAKHMADKLWSSLDNPINFHKGRSLAARRSAARLLKDWGVGSAARWSRLAQDSDPMIQKLASGYLKKIRR